MIMDFPADEIDPTSFFVTTVASSGVAKQQQQNKEAVTVTETTDCSNKFKTPQNVAPHQGGGKSVPPSKVKAKSLSRSTEEYTARRQKNNVAVKKSREKTKEKTMGTLENIERLKVENEDLEQKVDVLSQELTTLRKVFMDHAKGFMGGGSDVPDLKELEELLGHKLTEKTATVTTDASCSNR